MILCRKPDDQRATFPLSLQPAGDHFSTRSAACKRNVYPGASLKFRVVVLPAGSTSLQVQVRPTLNGGADYLGVSFAAGGGGEPLICGVYLREPDGCVAGRLAASPLPRAARLVFGHQCLDLGSAWV